MNLFGAAAVGLVEVVVVAWLLRQVPTLRAHADAISDVPLRGWWAVTLVAITPVLLGVVTVDNLRRELAVPYGVDDAGYPLWFVTTVGWGAAALTLAIGLALTLPRWRRPVDLPLS